MKRFYIGDVHGYSALLGTLLAEIDKRGNHQEDEVFFLGDLVDRGPDPIGVLDLVGESLRLWPKSHFILGNHDEVLLDIMRHGQAAKRFDMWMMHGGDVTMRAYGQTEQTLQQIGVLYPAHVALLEKAEIYHRSGTFIATHAGIDFTKPLDQQDIETFYWIRKPFLDHINATMPVVIHGHSPMGDKPVVTENRISIDTGIHQSGRLTCCVIDDHLDISFFQATADGQIENIRPRRLDRGFGTVFERKDLCFS